jgi:hypothetical protein
MHTEARTWTRHNDLFALKYGKRDKIYMMIYQLLMI